MNLLKLLSMIMIVGAISSCSNNKDVSDCENGGSSGGVFGETTYDCPNGNPSNLDIKLDSSNYLMGNIEAGQTYERTINISNIGDSKIFDFKIDVTNAEIIQNSCDSKFSPKDNCSLKLKIDDTISGNKFGKIKFSDKTGIINKEVPFSYQVLPSYPVNKKISYDSSNYTAYNQVRVTIGPLEDRFGNKINDTIKITTNREISNSQDVNFQSDPIVKQLIDGSSYFYIKSNQLNQNQLADTSEISIKMERQYIDESIVLENFSVSFLNNKPRISNSEQNFNTIEDIVSFPLVNLLEGEDYRGLSISYKLTEFPKKGTISNCLQGDSFITLKTCVYTPFPNYNGQDSFKYKVWNGESFSYEEAIVIINILATNDAPIIRGTSSDVTVQESVNSLITLPEGFDIDGDELTYLITTYPTKGSLSCNGRICQYVGQPNLVDNNDFLIFKVKDPSGLESNLFRININIKNVNEKPLLGGSEIHTTIEDTPFNFTLQAGTDPDINDFLIYKIKTNPSKGKLTGCLNNTNILNCHYIPNKNVDSADSFTYVAVDKEGLESDPRNVSIIIIAVNDAPIFSNLYQEVQTLPSSPINFNLLSAIDPEGNIVSYEIVSNVTRGTISSSCMSSLICIYNPYASTTSGYDEFSYRAKDSLGLYSDVRKVKIIIGSLKTPPTLTGVLNLTLNEDSELSFSLIQGNDLDTPQSELNYLLGSVRTQNGVLSGCMDTEGSPSKQTILCKYKPNQDFAGNDSFSYLVSDGSGLNSSELIVNLTINQVNDAPFYSKNIHEIEIDEDVINSLTLIQASDLENDVLTYSLITPPSHSSLVGDCLVDISKNCSLILESNYYGEDYFVVRATDSSGLFADLYYKLYIRNINDAPILDPFVLAFSVQEDTLSNFTLRSATDIDSNERDIVYRIDSLPTKGTITNCLGIGGVEGINCSYMPNSNEYGIDQFKYKAYDGEHYSNVLEVMISIQNINDQPYFEKTVLGPFIVEKNSPYLLKLEEAKDIENDDLVYKLIVSPTKGTITNCFNNYGILNCTYTPYDSSSGDDNFVYQAIDSHNSSYNNVQVQLKIEDEKFDRVFKLKTTNDIKKPNSISLDDNIYKIGESYVFNNTLSSLNYIMKRDIDKTETSISGRLLKDKVISYDNEIFFSEVNGINNTLKYINKNGINSIGINSSYNLSHPIKFNSNIYWGSNQSTLYRLNLLKIENKNKYYLDKVVIKDNLSINNSSSNVIPMENFNNNLFFKYQNDENQWLIGKIDSQNKLEKISNIKGKVFSNIKQSLSYDNGTNIKRIFFMVIDTDNKQKIFVYDFLQTNINDRFYEITANKTLQETLMTMSLFKSKSKDFIVMKDSKSNKGVYLRPDLLIIDYINHDVVDNIYVSKDYTRLMLQKDSTIKITSDNFTTDLNIVNLTVNPLIIDSFYGNRFFIKLNNGTYKIINSAMIVSNVSVSTGFNYSGKNNIYENETLLTSNDGTVESVHVYKDNFNYSIPTDNSVSYIDGLIGTSPQISSNPNKVNISNCMGLGVGVLGECKLTRIANSFGLDSYNYRATYNSNTVEFNVKLNLINEKPFEYTGFSDKLFLTTIDNNFKELIDYSSVRGEMYISVKDLDDKYKLFKINNGIINKLYESINPIKNLKSKNNYLYYTDTTIPQKIYRYNQDENESLVVFNDVNGLNMSIIDVYIDSDYNYFMVKNYGNPARDRIVKQNNGTLISQDFALPSTLVNGKFFVTTNGLYVVSSSNFAKFNNVDNTFVNNQTSTRVIYPELSTSVDNYLYFYVNNPTASNEYNVRVFDTLQNIYEDGNVLFNKDKITKSSSKQIKNNFILKLGNNSPYINISEILTIDNSSSYSEIIITEKDYVQGLLTDVKNIGFNVNDDLSMLKKIDDEFYFISNSSLNKLSFHKFGWINKNIAKYKNKSEIVLDSFLDKDDSVSYSLLSNPLNGILTNCMGLNSSSTSDLSCDYTHTGDSLINNSISYRAYDGKEYVDKTIYFDVINTKPYFINNNNININGYKNVSIQIGLENALDAENNTLYYIIDNPPQHGVLTNCNFNENFPNLNKVCYYNPNNNYIGNDSFTYYVTDLNKRTTISKTVSIVVNDETKPVFLAESDVVYVNKNSSSIIIKIPMAYDPNGLPINYITSVNPTHGTLTNCYIVQVNYLSCIYTPNNPNVRLTDSFSYRAYNGTYYSTTKIVTIKITGSNIDEGEGDFILTNDGPQLLKNGINNINYLTNIVGYHWNEYSKILTLPARQYNFNSIDIDTGVEIQFLPMTSLGIRDTETKFIEIYARGKCNIDGKIIAKGGYTPNPVNDVFLSILDKDDVIINHLIPQYQMNGFGGRNGGSSQVQSVYSTDYGTPTYFRGAEGQLALGDNVSSINYGGNRGFDGAPLILKCLDEISGAGVISVQGDNGESGLSGKNGNRNDSLSISYGGGGGSSGGNGGHSGTINIITENFIFNGEYNYRGGLGGTRGLGGVGDSIYRIPYFAEDGSSGSVGLDGEDGVCYYRNLENSIFNCN